MPIILLRYFVVLLCASVTAFSLVDLAFAQEPIEPPGEFSADLRRHLINLQSDDETIRREAVSQLLKLEKESLAAVPFVLSLIKDDRIEISFSKPRIVNTPATSAARVIMQLKRKNEQLEMDVEKALEEAFDQQAQNNQLNILFLAPKSKTLAAKALKSNDPAIVQKAVNNGSIYHLNEFANQLLLMLDHDSEKVVEAAVFGLANDQLNPSDRSKFVQKIPGLLDHDSSKIRLAAVYAVSQLETRQLIPELCKLVGDTDSRVTATAIRTLGNFETPKAVPFLLESIRSTTNAHERSLDEAIAALGKIGDARATLPLIKLLDSTERLFTKFRTIEALGDIGDRRAVNALLKQTDHPHASCRQYAVVALGKIGDPRGLDKSIAVFKQYPSEQTAVAIGEYRDVKALQALIDTMLKQEHFYNARLLDECAKSIKKIKSPLVVPRLCQAMIAAKQTRENHSVKNLIQALTGETFRSSNTGKPLHLVVEKWWKENQANYKADPNNDEK